jgi:hypothetical protein
MRLPISDCDRRRCEAIGRLAPPVLQVWLGGKQGQFAFMQEGGKEVVLPFSLNGFDQALAALRQTRGRPSLGPAASPDPSHLRPAVPHGRGAASARLTVQYRLSFLSFFG